jgi:hypothetical protein
VTKLAELGCSGTLAGIGVYQKLVGAKMASVGRAPAAVAGVVVVVLGGVTAVLVVVEGTLGTLAAGAGLVTRDVSAATWDGAGSLPPPPQALNRSALVSAVSAIGVGRKVADSHWVVDTLDILYLTKIFPWRNIIPFRGKFYFHVKKFLCGTTLSF